MSSNVGDLMDLSVVVKAAGVPTDDPGLTLTLEYPDATTQTFVAGDLTHGGPGVYSYGVVLVTAGLWRWTWTASAGFTGSDSGIFLVGTNLYASRPWCTPDEVAASTILSRVTDPDAAALLQSCVAATEFLHTATFRRFRGLREVELRPCAQHGYQRTQALQLWLAWPMIAASILGRSSPDPIPVVEGVAWNGAGPFSQIELPDDTQLVTSVLIDGEVFTDWRVDGGRRLTRTDNGSWPMFANVMLPETERGTFAVHAVVGHEPMELARLAAVELAAELYLAIKDPSECRLPARVQNVQRQGVSFTKVDTATLTKDGALGLRVCDIFLSRWGKRRRRPIIASPETPELVRRVGPGPL